jgi:hypothetical protein
MTATAGKGDGRSRSAWRLAPWVGAAALLAVPAVAMRFTAEVNWTAADFLVMGGMLVAACGALELAMRASPAWTYRAAAAVAVGTGFLLLWANLAVGLVGDGDNPANWLFVGVLALGAVGTILARLRPAGMARVAAATALAQLAAAAVAFAVTSAPRPGVTAEIVALFGIFPALWLLSAWLFHRAAMARKGA